MKMRKHTIMKLFSLFLLAAVSIQNSSFAQTHTCHSAGFDAVALPPPPLMEGIGTSAMPITTASPPAQKYFNQGLNLLHCFWDFEAYRAFKEAARLDSACAIAYWGIAAALQQNSSEMSEEKNKALEKAIALSATAGEREQAYIRAATLMRDKGRAAYISEMEALIDRYPDEIEAQLFLARFLSAAPSTYAPDGRPREGKVYGQMILQNLLKTQNIAPVNNWNYTHELKSSLARGYLNGLLHFAQGMEAIEKNKLAAAESHPKALDDLIQQLAGEKVQWGSDWYSGYGKKNLEVSALELRGALLNLQGRQIEAIQLLQEGAQKEKELGYWEPPHYARPVLESLAQIYLQTKKWEEARETYRQILRLRPNSGHALLGIARAFWGEGKKDHAAPAYAEFLQAWTQADATLPQIKEAKTRLTNGAR